MGPKKQNANKSKDHKLKKTRRHSFKLKLSSSKSVFSDANSLCSLDSESVLNMDSGESISTTLNQDIDYVNAMEGITPFQGFSRNATSKPQSSAVDITNLSVKCKTDASESITITSAKERKSSVQKDDLLNTAEACLLSSCSTNSSKSMIIASTETFPYGSSSNGDEIRSLNNVSQNTIDSSESTVVTNIINESESMNDNIDYLCRKSSHSSTSSLIDERDLQSTTSNNDSLEYCSANRIDSLNKSISEINDQLNLLLFNTESGSTQSTTKSEDANVFSSTNSFSSISFFSNSVLIDVYSIDVSTFSCSMCNIALALFISKKKELHERYILGKEWYHDRISWLKYVWLCIILKINSRHFRKSKRNACIQSIYKGKVEETKEYTRKFLTELKDISKFKEENCEIQMRKLAEVFDQFYKHESNYGICNFLKNFTLINETLENFEKLDILRERILDEKAPNFENCFREIISIIKIYFLSRPTGFFYDYLNIFL